MGRCGRVVLGYILVSALVACGGGSNAPPLPPMFGTGPADCAGGSPVGVQHGFRGRLGTFPMHAHGADVSSPEQDACGGVYKPNRGMFAAQERAIH